MEAGNDESDVGKRVPIYVSCRVRLRIQAASFSDADKITKNIIKTCKLSDDQEILDIALYSVEVERDGVMQ